MSRRGEIQMSPDEVRALLAAERIATVATIGHNGRPHVVPLWYIPRGTELATWTYGKSQKVHNLQRLPQATVLVETGESYGELRGVSMECDVTLIRDENEIADIGTELLERYAENPELAASATQFVGLQARKRVGLIFKPTVIRSWDHRKLGGTY